MLKELEEFIQNNQDDIIVTGVTGCWESESITLINIKFFANY